MTSNPDSGGNIILEFEAMPTIPGLIQTLEAHIFVYEESLGNMCDAQTLQNMHTNLANAFNNLSNAGGFNNGANADLMTNARRLLDRVEGKVNEIQPISQEERA